VYQGVSIIESSIIVELLDELFPSSPQKLFPESALLRARARLAMESCNFRLAPLFYRILSQPAARPALVEQLFTTIAEISKSLEKESPSGPYWFGEQFSIVDIVYFPFVDRSVVSSHPTLAD
jgi:glutathione S-transferase